MADSVPIQLAEAVKDHLNAAPAGTFGRSFTATREYVVEFRVKELKTLRVPVVPREADIEFEARAADRHEYGIDVGVLERASLNSPSEIDALMDLVQEISDRLRRTVFPLADGRQAVWSGIDNRPLYSQGHLREEGVFLSVITVSYRVTR